MKKFLIIPLLVLSSCGRSAPTETEIIHNLDSEGCCTPEDIAFIENQVERAAYLEAALEAHALQEQEGLQEMLSLAHGSAHKH